MDEILCLKSKINLLTTQLEQTKMLLEGQNNVVSALKEENQKLQEKLRGLGCSVL